MGLAPEAVLPLDSFLLLLFDPICSTLSFLGDDFLGTSKVFSNSALVPVTPIAKSVEVAPGL